MVEEHKEEVEGCQKYLQHNVIESSDVAVIIMRVERGDSGISVTGRCEALF